MERLHKTPVEIMHGFKSSSQYFEYIAYRRAVTKIDTPAPANNRPAASLAE